MQTQNIIMYLGIALFWVAFIAAMVYFEGPKVDCMRMQSNPMIDVLPSWCREYIN